MPGTQIFTYANFGKETTRGTPVAPTRQVYVDGTGVLNVDAGRRYADAERDRPGPGLAPAQQRVKRLGMQCQREASGVDDAEDLPLADAFAATHQGLALRYSATIRSLSVFAAVEPSTERRKSK